MACVGVDACTTGWIAVVLQPDREPEAHHLVAIDAVTDTAPDVEVVAVDIPIGLPNAGRRRADVVAKQLLGARHSSVFLTPVRAAVEAPSHAEATAASVRLTRAGVSQQAYRIGPKLLEVDGWLPRAPCPVFESHPELSFMHLLGRPARAPKKSWAGMSERRAALARAGISLDHVSGPAATAAAVDDMLDAAVVAWTATRLLRGEAVSVPDPPETNDEGYPMAIWA